MGASPRPAAGLLSDRGLRRLQAVGGFGGARLRGGEEGQGVMYGFCCLMRWGASLILGKLWQAPSADQRYHGYFLPAGGRRLPGVVKVPGHPGGNVGER